MLELLKYIDADFWVFLKICVILILISFWHPVEINVMNGYWKGKDDEG